MVIDIGADDAGPFKGDLMITLHVYRTKASMFNPLRIGNHAQKEALIGSAATGVDTFTELVAGSF